MGTGMLSSEEVVEYYRADAMKLFRYLSWLETKTGQSTSSYYGADGIATNSIAFPVYDSTLLSFVKEAENTCFMDRNYVYVYTRNRLKTGKDELRLIEKATIRDMDNMAGILSHYILGGRRKAALWSQGVSNGVYVALLKKMKDLIEYWDGERVKNTQE
ncbi:MAG: hypothetical protein IKW28_03130 [Lachnospiraceae bacterium]|nr:hypothetical protein [Lachnospiraceae bacterium]